MTTRRLPPAPVAAGRAAGPRLVALGPLGRLGDGDDLRTGAGSRRLDGRHDLGAGSGRRLGALRPAGSLGRRLGRRGRPRSGGVPRPRDAAAGAAASVVRGPSPAARRARRAPRPGPQPRRGGRGGLAPAGAAGVTGRGGGAARDARIRRQVGGRPCGHARARRGRRAGAALARARPGAARARRARRRGGRGAGAGASGSNTRRAGAARRAPPGRRRAARPARAAPAWRRARLRRAGVGDRAQRVVLLDGGRGGLHLEAGGVQRFEHLLAGEVLLLGDLVYALLGH